MEQAPSSAAAAGAAGVGGASGGPAPFLLKTYDMVDDSSTDDIVSWSSTNASFVVWNPPEFSSRLLPTYFKHNNFSSFIRQLNTYGFHKIDPERWEFSNEEFVKGQKHLLKNIHRRKPIHSHSNPPLAPHADAERAALEEEIDRLQQDKAGLQADLWRFKQQQSGTKAQLEDLLPRLQNMEQRQTKMVAFLQKAVQNPKFVENLVRMAESSATVQDFSNFHRKRRLPGPDYCTEIVENSFCENSASSSNSKMMDVEHAFNQELCDKLKLGLCPAFSDNNLVSPSKLGSNEDDHSPHERQNLREECLPLVPETLELSDTGASFCPRKSSLLLSEIDDGDDLVCCHLNLTLASSSMQVGINNQLNRIPSSTDLDVANDFDQRTANISKDGDISKTDERIKLPVLILDAPSLREAALVSNHTPVSTTGRVNDKFWEQFLTERPGSSDTEEASSSLREDPCDEPQEEMILVKENSWRNIKDMEQLTL